MTRKIVTLNIDTSKLTEQNRTAIIEMAGREGLNSILSEEQEYEYTEKEIANMTDAEFEANREKILNANASGKVL